MRLILVRHAHRETGAGRELDNGLSDKGRKQAQRVAHYFRDRFGKVPARLLSSPKLRCRETLEPLAEYLDVTVTINEELDEEGALGAKVAQFHLGLEARDDEWVVACSHGDWIPAWMERYAGMDVALEKGGWIELERERGGKFKLREILQALP